MRPSEVVRRGADYLERHGVQSPRANAELLMSSILGIDRAAVVTRAEPLTPGESRAYGRALCRRCGGMPLQHLTGEQGFRRLVLRARPGVFVPRPETEVLVDAALGSLEGVRAPVVADVCTGTGAVALAIADERPDATVHAGDLSPEAVALARENAEALGLGVVVHEGDLLEGFPRALAGTIDVVTCNPPYVPREREAELPAEVLADPPLAVFGGPPFYTRLFAEACVWVRPGGAIAVEIEESAAATITALASAAGWVDIVVRPDLAGRDRVV
ncbi:MAG: peptide chain release factor N(5)-glutamine methyltransferase, partial [Actinomycetota bacterium]